MPPEPESITSSISKTLETSTSAITPPKKKRRKKNRETLSQVAFRKKKT